MKKIILLSLIIYLLYSTVSAGGEVRQCIIEPFPPIITHQDSIMNDYSSPILYKFYDTFVRYDEPYTDQDTVTAVGWTFYLPQQPFQFDTILPKGTVYYRFYDRGFMPQWQFSYYGGGQVIMNQPNNYTLIWSKPYSIFSIKELENSCNHKKWQVLDSSAKISLDTDVLLTRWYLIIRDSIQNIIQIDSGLEVPMYTATDGRLIIHQRDNPVFEINSPGTYSVSFVVSMVNFITPDAPEYSLTDTSTIFVNVDCATNVYNNSIKNANINVQMQLDNQLQVQINNPNNNQDFIQIYTLDGKKIIEQSFYNNTILNMSQYSKGIYLITITEKNKIIFSDKVLIK